MIDVVLDGGGGKRIELGIWGKRNRLGKGKGGEKRGGELMIRIYKYVFPREFDDRSETNEEIGEYGGGDKFLSAQV